MDKAKPFDIPKREVWEAFKRVKAHQGAAGVDGQSIEQLEQDLENNLYRLWNRLCSGSYFPPPAPGGHTEGREEYEAVGNSDG
jgi:RNA-directed DNA polymerase